MKRHRVRRVGCMLLGRVRASLVHVCHVPLAQDPRQNEPGQVRFLRAGALLVAVLLRSRRARRPAAGSSAASGRSRSWCTGCGRNTRRAFRSSARMPAPRLDRNIVSSMLDLMPAPRLIFHEWDRHGVCSGLPARGYFETIRKARAVVKIPPEYLEPDGRPDGDARRGRGGLRQGQSGHEPRRHRDHLRRAAPERGAYLPLARHCSSASAPRSTSAPASATSSHAAGARRPYARGPRPERAVRRPACSKDGPQAPRKRSSRRPPWPELRRASARERRIVRQ